MKRYVLGIALFLFVFSPIILGQITPNVPIEPIVIGNTNERIITILPDQKTIDFGDAQGTLSVLANSLDISSQFNYTINTSKVDGKISISHLVIPNVLIAGNWNPSLFSFGVDTKLISREQFVIFHVLRSGLHPDENGNLFNSPFFAQTVKWKFGDTNSITFDQNTVFDSTHLVFKGFLRDFSPEIKAGFNPSQIKIANNVVSLIFTPSIGIRSTSLKIGDFFIDTNFSDGTFSQTQVAADANLTLDFNTATVYQLFGDYNSGIIDAGSIVTWNDFNWTETTPFYRELPDNNQVAVDANMQLTTTLLHLNGNANDTTVGYQGTILGNTNCGVNGLLDKGCYLDGSNDVIQMPSMAATSNVTTFTFSAWVARAKQTATGGRMAVFHASETGATDEVIRIEISDANIFRWDDDFGGAIFPSGVTCILQDVNKFYHIAATRSNSGINIYLNGQLCGTDSNVTANTGTMNAQIFFGGRTDANTSNLNGFIDEAAIFPRVLTDAEILNLAYRGLMDANFQVRSCDDSVCAGETFIGAGGTNATYFTDGNVNWDLNGVSANRYFQYRAFLSTLDGNRINVNTPKISQVSVRYTPAGGNNAPVVTLNSPNGAQYISQYRFGTDTNTLIDFNVSDADNPTVLFADIYLSTTAGAFTTLIKSDLNLGFLANTPTIDANCSGQPFSQSRQCFYDLNTASYADGNYFIDINVFDALDANKVDSSNASFQVDQNAPFAGLKRPQTNQVSAIDSQPVFAIQLIETGSGANSCRAHVFQNGATVLPYNRFFDTNGSGWCSFVPLTLASGDTAFVHFDVLTDNADNNRSIDVNTGIWTYSPSPANTAPVLDVNAIDGLTDRLAFPVFKYSIDGNLTIDVNVFDADNNRLFLDLNYSTSNAQGTGTPIVTDYNLTLSVCNQTNFNNSAGAKCSFDLNISPLLVSDNNYFILGLLNDKSGGTDYNFSEHDFAVDNIAANSSPILDINAIDGHTDRSGLPVFVYSIDGNLTVDFNAFDPENNRLTIDLNYSTSQTQGTGTVMVNDLNLTLSFCNDTNFSKPQGVKCSWDLNISSVLVSDNNYFILGVLSDGSLEDFNSTENSFAVDNIPPTPQAPSSLWINLYHNASTNTYSQRYVDTRIKGGLIIDTNLSVPKVCLNGDCRTAWPSGSGGGSDTNTVTAGWTNNQGNWIIDLNANKANVKDANVTDLNIGNKITFIGDNTPIIKDSPEGLQFIAGTTGANVQYTGWDAIVPALDNATSLGTTDLHFSNVFATTITVTGTIAGTSATFTDDLNTTGRLCIDANCINSFANIDINRIRPQDSNLRIESITGTPRINFNLTSNKYGFGTNKPLGRIDVGLNGQYYAESDQNQEDGELIRLVFNNLSNPAAKASIAFQNQNLQTKVWLVTHQQSTDGSDHNHFSIEVSDDIGQLQTRIGIPYDNNIADISFNQANIELKRNNGYTNGNFTRGGVDKHDANFSFYPNQASNGSNAIQIKQWGDLNTGFSALGSGYIAFEDRPIPIFDVTYDFGNEKKRWRTGWFQDANITQTVNANKFSARGIAGIDKNLSIIKDVDLIGLTKTFCDMNFLGGILIASTC